MKKSILCLLVLVSLLLTGCGAKEKKIEFLVEKEAETQTVSAVVKGAKESGGCSNLIVEEGQLVSFVSEVEEGEIVVLFLNTSEDAKLKTYEEITDEEVTLKVTFADKADITEELPAGEYIVWFVVSEKTTGTVTVVPQNQ
ncbi:MAG: hypothetical protein HUJ58_06275 [Erysipelotrichaceae bacterium]|nr:hypothetical protein [Erysipelotrichaceae bacterium]